MRHRVSVAISAVVRVVCRIAGRAVAAGRGSNEWPAARHACSVWTATSSCDAVGSEILQHGVSHGSRGADQETKPIASPGEAIQQGEKQST